ETCGAPQNLKRRKDGENRRKTDRSKSHTAQKRHEHQRDPNSKPFHETAGQENLNQHRDRIHCDIDIRQERRTRSAIVQLVSCQVRLLKICPRIRDRVDDEKRGETKKVGRSCNIRCSFPEFAADRFFTLLVMGLKIVGKPAYTLCGNLQHNCRDKQEEAGTELSCERTRDKSTNNSTNRATDGNKSKKSFALLW